MSPKESEIFRPGEWQVFLSENARKIVSVIIGLVVVVVVSLLVLNAARGPEPFKPNKKVVLGTHTFKVKTADTDKEKQIGLSQTRQLPKDYGMIFPFESEGYYSFWMRDMTIPIDIIYIKDNKIVKIFQNVPPPKSKSETLKLYTPPSPSDTVLEINSGLSKDYKLKEGDSIKIQDI